MQDKVIEFAKYQGLGNDFIIIDNRNGIFDTQNPYNLIKCVQWMCDRHFGIGADGVMFVENISNEDNAIEASDVRYRIFNSDGPEASICGNGLRCFTNYVIHNNIVSHSPVKVKTNVGVFECQKLQNGQIKIQLGRATLDLHSIPAVNPNGTNTPVVEFPLQGLNLISSKNSKEVSIQEKDQEWQKVTFVGTGNPHCVLFVDDVNEVDVKGIGEYIQNRRDIFPQSANVEFIQVISKTQLKMRVFERGCGETMACGTGACAAVMAALVSQKCNNQVTVELKGGKLEVEINESTHDILLTGSAEFVFSGKIRLPLCL